MFAWTERIVADPLARVVPARARIVVDGQRTARRGWRTVLFHKPRGVVTTRRDPEGRTTIYDVLGDAGRGLIAVGRLDLATSGLLLMTTDTQLANWIADPANEVPRVYMVTVRGWVDDDGVAALTAGVKDGRGRLRAHAVTIRKPSARESHLVVELREGKNREVRRLFAAIGHEVTRLKRVSLGGLELEMLEPGGWRDLSRQEILRLRCRRFPLRVVGRRTTHLRPGGDATAAGPVRSVVVALPPIRIPIVRPPVAPRRRTVLDVVARAADGRRDQIDLFELGARELLERVEVEAREALDPVSRGDRPENICLAESNRTCPTGNR